MKTIKKIITVFAILLFTSGFAQNNTIGVGPIKTFGVFATSETASTIARLELEQLGKYQVLDRFDMQEVENYADYQECYGKKCLIEFGNSLDVDFILSGSVDGIGNKIIITLKLIDVQKETIIKTRTSEFENQEVELQRMFGIVLKEMHDMTPDPIIKKQLAFKNDIIISNNLGSVNNSGPRMGVAYTTGTLYEFATRSERQGGLGISPFVSNIGYQFEGRYVGTENFSALFECLFNFTGLEQGQFLPSVSFLNGFRFGKQGWEFAFGPSFGITKKTSGFFTKDGQNLLGEASTRYWTENEFRKSSFGENSIESYGYEYAEHLDKRGEIEFNTRWVMAIGRTFKAGALNVPVNIYYSSQKGGGMAGLSVGFNISRSRTNIN